ncbi:hypothetical protein COHA_003602 [Chlorella ohadii]|uniref:Uncharacterized protein n=1 Tax=Chlorella ohadii TaxID=2649997 RepID=A0AAD5DUU9_9CHLO|nr:hypothetical protein COHA_003602 [Chlorella ohadii]
MQEARLEQLATVAPLLLPLDAAGTVFEGYVAPSAHAHAAHRPPASLWLRVSGLTPGAPSLRGAHLEVNGELAELLGVGGSEQHAAGQQQQQQRQREQQPGAAQHPAGQPSQLGGSSGARQLLAQRLEEAPSLPAFLVELQNMVDQASLAAAQQAQAAAARPASFYSRLKAELDSIGWRHVSSLSDDLSHLKLVATDAAGRRHELRLTLPPAYPATPPAAAADLPAAFEPRWAAGSGLADVLQQFEAALALHQLAWDSLDDLDRHAWVIEPTAAPRSVLYRRIALGSHVSLALTLDVQHPGLVPLDCRFMGSEAAVAPLRQRLHDNRGLWQEGRLLRLNLEAVLELQLPQRQGADAEDVSADCAICYAYRLPPADESAAAAGEEGDAPEINCDNPSCGKPFHRRCLVEWLNSAKVRLQIQARGAGKPKYHGILGTVRTVAADEGAAALWKGLAPGRPSTTTEKGPASPFRCMQYEPVKQRLPAKEQGKTSFLTKVRMQAEAKLPPGVPRRYPSALQAYLIIARQEGVSALWTGLGPNIARNVAVSTSALASYDQIKETLIKMGLFGDTLACHLASSVCAGFLSTVCGSPFDVVKSRMMSAAPGVYSGVADAFVKTLRNDGPLAFYNGFTTNWARLGTYNVVLFVTLEQMKALIHAAKK